MSVIILRKRTKPLGIDLLQKFNFNYRIKDKISKAMKVIGVISKISQLILLNFFILICKSFVRTHLDYGDVLYDLPNNESLCQNI